MDSDGRAIAAGISMGSDSLGRQTQHCNNRGSAAVSITAAVGFAHVPTDIIIIKMLAIADEGPPPAAGLSSPHCRMQPRYRSRQR